MKNQIREAFFTKDPVKSGNFQDCLTPPPHPVFLEKLTSNFSRFAGLPKKTDLHFFPEFQIPPPQSGNENSRFDIPHEYFKTPS